ncbi:MAG: hypothetical protein QF535_12110, partial [Anaerolineales bacterium]|nr:hypothetical protein [Anaerolineales bacterium]
IGTTAPEYPLHIVDGRTARQLMIESTVAASYPEVVIKSDTRMWSMATGGSGVAAVYSENFYIYDHDAPAQRLVIDTSGNVGIGTAAPDTTLHVYGAAEQLGHFKSSDATAYIRFGDHQGSITLGAISNGDFAIAVNGDAIDGTNDDFYIQSDGNVGINDTSPSYKLDVNGTFRTTGAATFDGGVDMSGTDLLLATTHGSIKTQSGGGRIGYDANNNHFISWRLNVDSSGDLDGSNPHNMCFVEHLDEDTKKFRFINSNDGWSDVMSITRLGVTMPGTLAVSGTSTFATANATYVYASSCMSVGTGLDSAYGLKVTGKPILVETGGSNTYGQYKGYNNNNHFLTCRG